MTLMGWDNAVGIVTIFDLWEIITAQPLCLMCVS